MLTRRDALLGGVAACAALASPGAATCQAQPAPLPRPRQRLQDFMRSNALVAAYMRAVASMKLRNPSDPTSWFFQAAVHGVSTAEIKAAMARDRNVTPALAAQYWNKCPHGDGVRSADFLVWHRAYLFHFEQILREASGDPGFSLPYWDYLDPTQRQFPTLFSASVPNTFGQPRNPLYEPRRNPATTTLGVDYEFNFDGVPPLNPFAPGTLFGVDPSKAFGGTIALENGQEGFLESGLHDTIHVGIGGSNGLMSDVQSAAFDPVFWVHHANIDRIWTVYDCLPNKTWGTPPDAAWLNERPWFFYDAEMGEVRNEPRSFYMHRGNLEVRYDSDIRGCRDLTDKPLRQAPTIAVLGPQGRRFLQDLNNAAMSNSAEDHGATHPIAAAAGTPTPAAAQGGDRIALAADQPTFTRITDALAPNGLTKLSTALEQRDTAAARRVFLELDNLALTRLPNVRYRVFANYAGDHVTSADGDAYVGTLAIFGVFKGPGEAGGPAEVTEHGMHRTTQRFDITAQVSGLADPSAVKVAVVPEPLLRPLGATPPLAPEGDLSIKSFRVIVT